MKQLPAERLVVLDVGHGNCAVMHVDDSVVVLDAGTGATLLSYLSEEKISSVDAVLLSHSDEDHIRGLIELLASNCVEVGKVYLNPDSSKNSKLWDDLLFELDQRSAIRLGLTTSTGNFEIGNTEIKVLAPTAYLAGKGPGSRDRSGRRITSNTASTVLHISHKGKSVAVFTGDLDKTGLENLLESSSRMVHAPTLIFPHHGGGIRGAGCASFTYCLLDNTKPRNVIFSIGRHSRGKTNPSVDIVDAVVSSDDNIRVVCTQLSKHCSEHGVSSCEHVLPIAARGKELNRCCAGSLLINLNEPEEVLPFKDHQIFLQNTVEKPICVLKKQK